MSEAGSALPSSTTALTPNQKKKQRQKRAKHFRRLLGVQAGVQASGSQCLVDISESSLEGSADGSCRSGRGQSHSEPQAASLAESSSAVSRSHALYAAPLTARGVMFPPSAQLHSRDGTQSWTADQATPQQSATGVSGSSSYSVATKQADGARSGATAGPNRSRLDYSANVPHTAALLAGVLETGASPAASGDTNGSNTDMTAALLVMQSLLAQHPPAAVPGGSGSTLARKQDVAVHGNYKRYYGYRWAGSAGEDPRLQVLERSWFAGKRCLDVGCNEGLVSMAVAVRSGAAAMLGIDIDGALIKRACANLSRMRGETAAKLVAARQQGRDGAAAAREAVAAQRALKGIWFQQGDMAGLHQPVEPGSVDAALCLSVTKWVHINGGDAALQALFAALHAALRPGGLLVLEPQTWRSYKQALRKQELAGSLHAGMLASLQLRPEGFVEYLEREAGFRLVRELNRPDDGSTGFDRPMYLFEKLAVQ